MEFLDISIKSEVSQLLNTQLFSGRFSDNEIYELLDECVSISDLNSVYQNLLQEKSHLKNLGIDLPLWFGDFNSANKTMVVALDPKRNKQENKEISVGSIFSLHTEEGKKTNKNDYWSFISYLSQTDFVYLTDIYKIYYETKDKNGQNIVSNKDKDFIDNACYQHNKSILDDEINKIVKPNRIITLGNDAANAVKRIKDIKTNEIQFRLNEIDYLLLPHISRTVTQSIKTIGNLYKGLGIVTQKEEITKIGNSILNHSELKQILTKT